MPTSPPVSRALPDSPALTGRLRDDAALVHAHAARTAERLATLPPTPERTGTQREFAARTSTASHALRARFMRCHAEQVYDHLTIRRRDRPALKDLLDAASAAFPGLLPTPDQLAAEAGRPQRDKEGHEIAQGVFLSEVLRAPGPGRHLIDTMLRPTARARTLLPRFQQTAALDLGPVRIERREAVGHVTLQETSSLNAENDEVARCLETAVDLVLLDPAIRIGVLRGGVMTHPRHSGRRVFSSGLNLKDLRQGRITFLGFFVRRELGYLHKIVRGLLPASDDDGRTGSWPDEPLGKPWLAAVDTFAIGGGAQLLPLFDHTVAGADSYLSLPAAQEGLVPGAANLRLHRTLGSRLTRSLILGERRIRAHEDLARLLFDQVAEPQDMDAAIERGLHTLDRPSVRTNRHLLWQAEEPPETFRTYMSQYALHQALRLYDNDVADRTGPPR